MRSDFDYYRPDSVQGAIAKKTELGNDAFFWAGGTDLMLQWKHEVIRPLLCIDLIAIDGLSYIKKQPGLLCIGAMTTLSELEHAIADDPYLHTLSAVAALMATQQTRTIATIAGNLCNASPAADLLPPLIAMNAYLLVDSKNSQRKLAVKDLLISPGKTNLQASELVTEICIPFDDSVRASSYRRIDRTVVDIALVSVAAAITVDNDQLINTVVVSMGAVAPKVIRSDRAEKMLIGKQLSALDDELLTAVGKEASLDATPIDDIRASADYRKAMVKVLVKKVLQDIVSSLWENKYD